MSSFFDYRDIIILFRFKSILDEIIKDPKQPQTVDHLKKFLDAGLFI
jgi:hypothetical protein